MMILLLLDSIPDHCKTAHDLKKTYIHVICNQMSDKLNIGCGESDLFQPYVIVLEHVKDMARIFEKYFDY